MSEKQYLEKQNKYLNSRNKIWKAFSIFLIVVLVVILFVLLSGNKIKQEKQYPFLDPLVGQVNRQDLISNIEPIRNYLINLEQQNKDKFKIAIYFENLNTGANVNINNDYKIWPASLTKLPLVMVVMKKVEEGVWNLNDELVLLQEDLDSKSGDMYSQNSVGTRFTVDQLIIKLLVDSGNTAYKILYRNLSETDYLKLINSIGLDQLFNKEGKISPKEYSRLLRSLYYSTFLSPKNSEKILQLLTSSSFKSFLSKGLPAGILFAHKYGENLDYNVFSDFGIVYVPGRPYLIAVSIEAIDPQNQDETVKKVEGIMQAASKFIFDYVQNY